MSSTDLTIVPPEGTDLIQLGVVHANRPAELVQRATEAADALAAVIEAKQLYSNIQGKKFVRAEGWGVLAAMMGCLPREVSLVKREDGAFVATVELVRMHDGAILSCASAECGKDEPTWKGRPDYARRSMAATRATSKVCRLAFSWVMVLAGFQPTPAEEIPHDSDGVVTTRRDRVSHEPEPVRHAQGQTNKDASPGTPLSERPRALDYPDAPQVPSTGPKWRHGKKAGTPLAWFKDDELPVMVEWAKKKNTTGEYTRDLEDLYAEQKRRQPKEA